jgi:transposase-like protein
MPRGSNFQKPYPPEFRRQAVALYQRAGRPLGEIGHDLGVSTETLRAWTRRAQVDDLQPPNLVQPRQLAIAGVLPLARSRPVGHRVTTLRVRARRWMLVALAGRKTASDDQSARARRSRPRDPRVMSISGRRKR